jgi:hypothetical protein
MTETFTNEIPKRLTSYLSISFNLGTGIREKLINNNKYN